ncbi:hypothetical protein [Modicisalibacter xianhensis]|uniref:Uncharacterized protein n=1 Tax=Modicisalibacter xianhensis TaxID=442341 RepID=A0A1I2YMV2_9GAMM|nr:hypothetical protein [Halomonas xianhensis]SFH26867.1 hypothetical protein SAMN04487959_10223 [Halomonas xianhensis]
MNVVWRVGVAALLDAAYLVSYWWVMDLPWLSYGLLLGWLVGAVAARQWWLKSMQAPWQGVLLALSLVLPCLSWTMSRQAAPAGLSGPRHGVGQRVAMAFLLCLVLLASGSGLAERRVLGPAMAPVETTAVEALNRSLVLAAASYGSARLIDRGIALVSEAELTLPVIGGVAVKPGQFFKPLQDMAERYSDVMVVAMASIGIQRVLIELGHNASIAVLGSTVALILLISLMLPSVAWRLGRLARGALVLLVVARLMVPLAVTGVAVISDAVLEPRRIVAQQQLDTATAELQEADVEALEAEDSGLFDWMRELRDETTAMALDVRGFSDDMVDRFIQLLVVYLLETVLLPLGLLVALWWVVRTFTMPPMTNQTSIERHR